MPTFQFLLHTSGIQVEIEGDPIPAIGFFTSRRARAATSEEAFDMVMRAFDTDSKLTDIFQTAHDAGLRPKTDVEEVYLIPWWKAILPWKERGLCFYPPEDPDESSSSD